MTVDYKAYTFTRVSGTVEDPPAACKLHRRRTGSGEKVSFKLIELRNGVGVLHGVYIRTRGALAYGMGWLMLSILRTNSAQHGALFQIRVYRGGCTFRLLYCQSSNY